MSEEVVGAVVQLDPFKTENKAFAGCFMVVTQLFPWGVQGYIQGVGTTQNKAGGQAYYRARSGTFELIGKAVWSVE
jgi:hypothetical protein